MYFNYSASGTPMSMTYNGANYYYVTSLQGDVIAILNSSGTVVTTYLYDAWGNILSTTGTLSTTVGRYNPLRYRGYIYDRETKLYYLQSRYYNPETGRFINADGLVSTGQGLMGNNMFAYCGNNPVNREDSTGNRYTLFAEGGGSAPNDEHLMAFYGVDSSSEIPEMPEDAMIFVENITTISVGFITFIEGKTVVLDRYKYCEYFFYGYGLSFSKSIPWDKTITQGYVYGLKKVEDYCGIFTGASGNMLANAFGGAVAAGGVYAEITNGMGFAPSVGFSITDYKTGQSDWIFGTANIVKVQNPYQNNPLDPSPYV